MTVPRRTRSFNDVTNRAGENRSLPKIPENTVAGVKRKLPKTAAWTKSHPGDKPASRPATAPSRPLQARSNSLEQLETSATEGKSSFRTVLDSLVQSEKRKSSLAPAAREKTRDQLLHHFKSKRALDIVSSANKERKPSRRTLGTKRDWPFSIFRAKSSNDLNRSVESSDFKNFGADPSSLSGPKCEHEMTWSDIPNTHTLNPNPGGSPRLPTFTLCTPVKESFEEEKAADQEEEAELELTALPPLGPSAVSMFDHAISQKPTAYICADSALRVHEDPLKSDVQSFPLDAMDTTDPNTVPPETLKDKTSRNIEQIFVSSGSATSEATGGCESLPIDLASQPSHKSQLPLPPRSSKGKTDTPNQKSVNGSRPKGLQNLSSLTSESLIEFLAATPPASPIVPAPADSSRHLAEITKQQENRSSRARLGLGIKVGLDAYPEEVSSPPPPGPGGRVMVSPDYAAQCAFEGEKRMKMKRSFGSVGGRLISRKRSLRRLFSTSSKGNVKGGGVVVGAVNGGATCRSSPGGKIGMNEGEIFCFHGMRKDGTWVTT